MSRPVIGVTGSARGGWLLWRASKLGIRLAGGRARRIRPGRPYRVNDYDGFVISGGIDINPERYGEAALKAASRHDLPRDEMEHAIIHAALEQDKPLLGICRGMQMLNVALGGSLYQDAADVLEDFLPNTTLFSKLVGRRRIVVRENCILHDILGRYDSYYVNSIHHQAVNRPGKGLRITAREANGLVQAVELREQSEHPFVLGVQWHPELMLYASSARRLFRALVQAASHNASASSSPSP